MWVLLYDTHYYNVLLTYCIIVLFLHGWNIDIMFSCLPAFPTSQEYLTVCRACVCVSLLIWCALVGGRSPAGARPHLRHRPQKRLLWRASLTRPWSSAWCHRGREGGALVTSSSHEQTPDPALPPTVTDSSSPASPPHRAEMTSISFLVWIPELNFLSLLPPFLWPATFFSLATTVDVWKLSSCLALYVTSHTSSSPTSLSSSSLLRFSLRQSAARPVAKLQTQGNDERRKRCWFTMQRGREREVHLWVWHHHHHRHHHLLPHFLYSRLHGFNPPITLGSIWPNSMFNPPVTFIFTDIFYPWGQFDPSN